MAIRRLSASATIGAAVLSLFAADVAAQSRNVSVLASPRLSNNGRNYSGNDIWAYTAPNGKEYAIVGSTGGTHIFDCTNPSAPVQRGFVATAGSRSNTWRDMKVFGQYAYVVSESHGGVQVIDLRNPDAPVYVGRFLTGNWSNAHNIAMDFDTGIAYVCGTRTAGLHLVDVKTNPRSPRLIRTYSTPYVHDLSIENGFAYLAEQNSNRLKIIDVSNTSSIATMSSIAMPGARIAHNTWPSHDGTLCVTTNEVSRGPTTFFDISNKRAPRQVATYFPSGGTLPHNAFFHDRNCYISHYDDGVRVLDSTSGASPVEVGYYVTATDCWGVSLPVPSGHIYGSTISSGRLYVLRAKATRELYGNNVAGQGGKAPEAHTFGAAYLGNSRFALDVREARPSSAGVMILGAGRGTGSIAGIPLNVRLASPSAVFLPITTNTGGEARVPLAIPNNASYNGAKLNAQFVISDAAATPGFSSTRGMEIELFQR